MKHLSDYEEPNRTPSNSDSIMESKNTMRKWTLLTVGCKPEQHRRLANCLEAENYTVLRCERMSEVFRAIESKQIDIVVAAISSHTAIDLNLLTQLNMYDRSLPVIALLNREHDNAQAVDESSFCHLLSEGYTPDELLAIVHSCQRNTILSAHFNSEPTAPLGKHTVFQQLLDDCNTISHTLSTTACTLAISGERGSGKAFIAQYIHRCISSANTQFIKINCATISKDDFNVLISNLSGHSDTLDTKSKYRDVRGTLFLQEVTSLPLSLQNSLLIALEKLEQHTQTHPKAPRVICIASSSKNLQRESEEGRFSQDLLAIISRQRLECPALRDRVCDIAPLAQYFLDQTCDENGLTRKSLCESCIAVFNRYGWPGNIAELKNAVERMVLIGGDRLGTHDIPTDIMINKKIEDGELSLSLKAYRERIEREFIIQKLRQFKGNITKVAKSLSIDRTHLHKKLNQYDIQRDRLFI